MAILPRICIQSEVTRDSKHVLSELSASSAVRASSLQFILAVLSLSVLDLLCLAVNMPGRKEPADPENEEQLLGFDPGEDDNTELSGENHLDTPSVMAVKDHGSDSNNLMSHADVKLLSSAILTLSEKIDKFGELPSKGKEKGKGKWLSDDREHHHGLPAKKPAKDGSSSLSDQHAFESEEDIEALME